MKTYTNKKYRENTRDIQVMVKKSNTHLTRIPERRQRMERPLFE